MKEVSALCDNSLLLLSVTVPEVIHADGAGGLLWNVARNHWLAELRKRNALSSRHKVLCAISTRGELVGLNNILAMSIPFICSRE